jgi:hypothetical protein
MRCTHYTANQRKFRTRTAPHFPAQRRNLPLRRPDLRNTNYGFRLHATLLPKLPPPFQPTAVGLIS